MPLKYTIVVASCDSYEPLWPAFFRRFFKYWPEPHPQIVLITNNKSPKIDNVNIIKVGNEKNWSGGLLNGLSKIEDEYIFLLLDDIFIDKKIKIDQLNYLTKFIEEKKINYLNTKGLPYPRGKKIEKNIREVVQGSHYRASLCNAFWNKNILSSLLKDGESPWEFEVNGTKRSEVITNFFGTNYPLIEFKHVVVRGQKATQLPKNEVNIDGINQRFPQMSKKLKIYHELSKIRGRLYCFIIPQSMQSNLRIKIRDIFK